MKWGTLSGSDISDASTTPPNSIMERQADSCAFASSLLTCLFLNKTIERTRSVKPGEDKIKHIQREWTRVRTTYNNAWTSVENGTSTALKQLVSIALDFSQCISLHATTKQVRTLALSV